MAFYQEISYCLVPDPSLLGDGICDNFGKYNTIGCNFDNGDCLEFNKRYPPSCKAPYPFLLGDKKCEKDFNTPSCEFDGGDCLVFNRDFPDCKAEKPYLIGNGRCDDEISEHYNTTECGFDGMDCLDWWEQHSACVVDSPAMVGDGVCNAEVNTFQCGFDKGDCADFNNWLINHPNCVVENPSWVGDGSCDSELNTPDCSYDDGDCADNNFFLIQHPNCVVDSPSKIGDNRCHAELNIPECGFDKGDCTDFNKWMNQNPNCVVDNPSWIGDGRCDLQFNTHDCSYDKGDCKEFNEFVARYPDCDLDYYSWQEFLGDGIFCDKELNTPECGYDKGDCRAYNDFVTEYPGCNLVKEDPFRFGNGYCEKDLNTIECGYDNGECNRFNQEYPNCSAHSPFFVGDNSCDNDFNTANCGFDGGDCEQYNAFVEKFPLCAVDYSFKIGDGLCDHGNYNTPECDYDSGDCSDWNEKYPLFCIVENPSLVGDGTCNGPPYNSEQCGYDGGDCLRMEVFIQKYPNCVVDDATRLGDGVCDEVPYNSDECGHDNGDCMTVFTRYPNCTDLKYTDNFGDGFCHNIYNTHECGFDGGDCLKFNKDYPNCIVEDPWKVGFKLCSSELNTPECGYDGGDCYKFNNFTARHPNCKVDYNDSHQIGDGKCHVKYNSPECAWDYGDCNSFNVDYPGCPVDDPSKLGNGRCDGFPYNTLECNYDDGDCEYFNTIYPNCSVVEQYLIGDGICDGIHNTADCDYDGNDCADFNAIYPDCYGVETKELGDGICQHNSAGCNFDDGDCVLFNTVYPKCNADKPFLVSNGYCDDEYNTEECKNDGSDCLSNKATIGQVLFIGGDLVTAEQYRQNTRLYSIVQTFSSIISLLASIGIIWILCRSYKKLLVPLHRLLVGLCMADIVSSFAQSFSTYPSPDSFDVIWNANGSKASCRTQGFFIFIGSIGAPLYTCSLCIYYLLVVTYRKGKDSDSFIEGRIEFFLHAVPIVISLVGAATILSMDAFNPNMTYCFIGTDPTCEDLKCERENEIAKVLFIVFSAGPYLVLPCVIIVTMSLMYRAVRMQEKKRRRFGAHAYALSIKRRSMRMSSKLNITETTSDSSVRKSRYPLKVNASIAELKSKLFKCAPCQDQSQRNRAGWQRRAILNRAASYSLAFLITYLFPVIISIRTLNGSESGHVLSILARVFFPLQGFFNFTVFIFPKVIHMKKPTRNEESVTWRQAFVKAVQSRGKRQRIASIKLKASGNFGLKTSFLLSVNRANDTIFSSLASSLGSLRGAFFGLTKADREKSEHQRNDSHKTALHYEVSNYGDKNLEHKEGEEEFGALSTRDGSCRTRPQHDSGEEKGIVSILNTEQGTAHVPSEKCLPTKTIRFAENVIEKLDTSEHDPEKVAVEL